MFMKKTWLNLIILGLLAALLVQVGSSVVISFSKAALAISNIDKSTINRPVESSGTLPLSRVPSINEKKDVTEEPGKIIRDLYDEVSPIFIESGKAVWGESKKIWDSIASK
jgi:hypothetical protein